MYMYVPYSQSLIWDHHLLALSGGGIGHFPVIVLYMYVHFKKFLGRGISPMGGN